MSVQSQIDRITDAKADIVTSIENQGVSVAEGATIDTLSTYIDAINNSDHNHEITQVNGLQTALNGKMSVTTSNGLAYLATKTYIPTQSEYVTNGSGSLLPFINNDLGHLLSRGYSCSVYTTSSTNYTASSLTKVASISGSSALFDGTPSYVTNWSSLLSASTTADPLGGGRYCANETLVFDITCPTYAWGNMIYLDFGQINWRAPNIAVYVMKNGTETVYTQIQSITGNKLANYYVYVNRQSTGFDRIRIVLKQPLTVLRIAQIGLINYSSQGAAATLVSRGGSNMFGSLTPAANKGASLGNSSQQWLNIYGNTIYEGGTALSSKYVTIADFEAVLGSYIDEIDAVLGGD